MRAHSLQAWWSEEVNKLFLPKATILLNENLGNNHSVKSIEQFKKNLGFSHSSVGKESACNSGDPGLIPGSERSPGEGNGNPLQYSCLENPMDRGAWRATVHEVARVRHDLATKPPTTILEIYGISAKNSVFGILVNCFSQPSPSSVSSWKEQPCYRAGECSSVLQLWQLKWSA